MRQFRLTGQPQCLPGTSRPKLLRQRSRLLAYPRRERAKSDEAKQFLIAVQGTRWESLWVLLLTTGLRPGEALGLKWSDIEGGKIRVQRALTRVGRSWALMDPKTAKARRVVTLPKSAEQSLSSRRVQQIADRLHAGPGWHDNDLIFTTRTGEPLDYRTVVSRHFRPILAAHRLRRIRPYDLRHSCATLLLGAGENVKVVSERLGHASGVDPI